MRKLWFIACEDPTVSEQLFCCLFFVKCCKILRHRPTEFSNLLFRFIYLSSEIDGRKNPFTITILSRPFYLVQRKDLQIISINFQLKLFSQSKKNLHTHKFERKLKQQCLRKLWEVALSARYCEVVYISTSEQIQMKINGFDKVKADGSCLFSQSPINFY